MLLLLLCLLILFVLLLSVYISIISRFTIIDSIIAISISISISSMRLLRAESPEEPGVEGLQQNK